MKDMIAVELLKLKRSKILWVVILAPVLMVMQGIMNFRRYYDLFTGAGQNAWQQLYTQCMIFYAMILLPVLISLVMTFVARIENAHQGWKQYLSLPVKRETAYLSKFVVAAGLVFINVIALILSMLLAGPFTGVAEKVPYQLLLGRPLAAYLAALPMMTVLYVLSLRYTQLAVPLGVGIGLTMPAILAANSKLWFIYPWTYPIMAALGGDMEVFDKGPVVYLASLVLGITVLFYGLKSFRNRDLV
ncbi:MAG TPA: ABC transporter permease subunit [Clostridia bacterium]|nr:ABC transporter permease subunit [Clostridia bacterium]